MLPNVRLMIAATLASVVALVCGFGMFAVFRVSHDPFARLPAATAPLQLVAGNAAKSAAGLAPGEPFDRRFQVKASPNTAAEANAAAAAPELRAEPEAAPATPAQSAVTAPEEIPSTAGEPTEQPSAPKPPTTSEAPAVTSDNAAASDQANMASASQPETTTQTTTADAGTMAPSPNTTTADPDQDIKSPVVSMPTTEPAPHPVLELAVNGPPLPRERAMLAAKPTGAASPPDDRAHKTAAKKAKRIRVAVRIRRLLRVAAAPYAQTQSAPSQYAPTAEQNFGDTQTNFRTATPPQTQYLVRRAVPVRHFRIAAKKSKEPKQPNAATGGPFVSATRR
jgi:hypothetical protein